jgi:drug/metabolite transporter (DMT)-like permease
MINSKNSLIRGVFLVGLGATSYGMLATFVKLAYAEGFTTVEVTISQFVYGLLGLVLINVYNKLKASTRIDQASSKNIFQLMLAGTSLGLTSVFYYLAIKYIPVSIAIILLMQTVWMGVLLEAILDRKLPSLQKSIAVVVVLFGTILATNLIDSRVELQWQGLLLGMLSAASFTTTMFTSNRVATNISSAQRSLFMLLGGFLVIIAFSIYAFDGHFNFMIFMKWGIVVSLFGTIIPPMLFNAGFPKTGIGLGSIVASLELPVSVLMAYFLLNETVVLLQLIGILMIIMAIVIMNIDFKSKA